MGYFSNGSEGMDYEEAWCSKCHFQPDVEPFECQIMFLHALFNYDQHNKDERGKAIQSCLDALIPSDEQGLATRCNFFMEKSRHKQPSWLEEH